ncbi:MAG: tripartite tricarboxylate transporter substrate binding protein [Rubrivivax sp.]|nr:tripartite tricarboxylate transporter substrate binding protein [Rubrivivax sp.]
MDRRQSLAALALAYAFPTLAQENYPSRPIRLIVAFGTGSANDIIARGLARFMSEDLEQSVVVESRAGAGGTTGTGAVARAAPDGYTIGLGTGSQLVMNVGLYKTLPFDVDRDLRSIGLVSRTSLLLAARAGLPRTLPELIAYARANPGKVNFGSAGAGSINHIMGEAFAEAAGISLLHVPYKGNGPALNDLAGGHLDLLLDVPITALPLAQSGKAQVLAVSSQQRSAVAPQVPTFAESGLPDYQAYSWNNLFAP